MDKKTRGGNREGSGRKPAFDKKRILTLYVLASDIAANGGDEKLKKKIYEGIANRFVSNPISERSDSVFDSEKRHIGFTDEFTIPTTQKVQTLTKFKKSFEYYQQAKIECPDNDAWLILKEDILESDLPVTQKKLLTS